MGDCEGVTFGGEWDIAITQSYSIVLNWHIFELPEISVRNFFGKQTTGNNKHLEISCSSLSPPDSKDTEKPISSLCCTQINVVGVIILNISCFISSRNCSVKRISFWKYLSNQSFMMLKYGSKILIILWTEIKLLGRKQRIYMIIYDKMSTFFFI